MKDTIDGRMWASFAKLGAIAGTISVTTLQLGAGFLSGPLGLVWAAWFVLLEIPVATILGAVAGLIVGIAAEKLNISRLHRPAQIAMLATLGFVAVAAITTLFGLLTQTGTALFPIPVTGLIGAISFTPYGLSILNGHRILIARSAHRYCARVREST